MRANATRPFSRGFRRRRLLGIWLAVFAVFALAAGEVLVWPQASGDKVAVKGGTQVDYSHAEDGYVMISQEPGSKRYKLRMEKDGETYTYDLNSDGAWEIIPLQLGTGTYAVKVFKQASGNKYSSVSSQKIQVDGFSRENACFLCPNQYVYYTPESAVVALSQQLCANLTEEREKVQAVRDWVKANIRYDYVQALTVQSGYLPDLDQVLEKKMGICFDYASLTAALLRVQGIAVKLVIGYADNTYHAWNEVYLSGQWVRLDITAQASNMNVKSYTTERFY